MSPKQVIKDPTDGFIVDEVGAWASEKHERLSPDCAAAALC
jgi:hypothetical protein